MAEKTNETKKKDGTKKAGRLGKCLKAPVRILSMAIDFYVRTVTDCSSRARCGGPSTAQLHRVPRSHSSSSSKSTILYTDEDFRELIRAASTRSLRDNYMIQLEQDLYGYCRKNGRIARSFTSGIGRIDEDKPCDFGEESSVEADGNVLCPRSRSHAVVPRARGGFIIS